MSTEPPVSEPEIPSTCMKVETECNMTCTTGFSEPRPLRLKSILKQNQHNSVISTSRKELDWSDRHGLNLHEIREYTVSEREDEIIEEKRLSRRSSCCLIM
eukprot:g5419.t1